MNTLAVAAEIESGLLTPGGAVCFKAVMGAETPCCSLGHVFARCGVLSDAMAAGVAVCIGDEIPPRTFGSGDLDQRALNHFGKALHGAIREAWMANDYAFGVCGGGGDAVEARDNVATKLRALAEAVRGVS
jgi:hypothetical protein